LSQIEARALFGAVDGGWIYYRPSFFALLQKNVLNRRRWTTREDLRLAIVIWIERPTIDDAGKEPSAT
jgi:hypothetical protein